MTERPPSPSPAPPEALADALPELVAELVRTRLAHDRSAPARPLERADALGARLPLALDGRACAWPDAVALLRDVLDATPSTSGPRFHNQLFGGRDPIAVLGDVASVLANVPMHTFKASGVQVLIERAVLRRMGELAGMPSGDGIVVPGGSLSNLAAMLLARNHAFPAAREHGLPGGPAAVYASEAAHYSVRKAAGILGLGRHAVRQVPVDPDGRMQPHALARMIDDDRAAGVVPVLVVATAGTTVLGAFDPLPALADVAERASVWLHVDAAYGGSVLLSPRHRHRLAGCERADSITWDAHKLLTVPLTCSVLLTRHPDACAQSLGEPASYLFQDGALLDPGIGSLQCARKNDALKLWLAWKHHGDEGLARRIDHLFDLAAHLVARVRAEPRLRLVRPPASLNVCFDVVGKDPRVVCHALWDRGLAQLGHALVDERPVVRWVLVDPALEPHHLDRVLADLLAVAADLPDA